ncbi:DNA-binding transcriptional regulator, AcrR family [Amycolatopsis arida]|uniref:DNA-binding transcriptional regulator, AcrR family n=1 Tax=Amycolatopsis arida TaxID=587909 RepID=A0A1I5P3L0_9PSEU|nr:TetR/AcrR family transcriptional regulator [Amycolatopsis arida]TDX98343.1 AcrR family transcriptional regulator [Amycolatopsis arida]SFP28645.1 DNA-binding transcriptional regulator, AcrR family [Amycolatopsis arida]
MPRPTRAESQARTRQRLLATARELFLRDGYAATSLEKVADAAGFSKGAVYSNFRGKNELCLAVLDAIHAEQAEELATALAGAGTLDGTLAALRAWAERSIGDEEWTALEVEFATNARHDPVVRRELASRAAAVRARIAELVEAHAARFDLTLPLPAPDCAAALLGMGIGLGVQRAIDPDVPVGVLPDVLRLLATPRQPRET